MLPIRTTRRNIISIIGYAIVLLVPHGGTVLAGTFLFLAWSCFSLPVMLSLIGAALHEQKHAMGIGVQSVIKRLPIIVGPYAAVCSLTASA